MQKIWILVILAIFIQEPASTDAAIFQIRHFNLNLLIINLIWVGATLFDIWFGYSLGKFIQKRFKGTSFDSWSFRWAVRIENFIGKKGEKFALILLGIINFPYLNSFFASWLKIPFKNVLLLIFVGDLLYWLLAWCINISIRDFFVDPHTALYVVIGTGLVFSILAKTVMNRILKSKN